MSGKPTKVDLDKDTQIDVRCQVSFYPFYYIINMFFFTNMYKVVSFTDSSIVI